MDPEFEAVDMFALGGYFAVQAFKRILTHSNGVSQIAFYGGDADVLAGVSFPEEEDLLMEAIFRNDVQSLYGALIRPVTDDPDLLYPQGLQVELFDYMTGMTGMMFMPYDPETATTPLVIYRPMLVGLQTGGVLNEDEHMVGVSRMSLVLGAMQHPEHEQFWDPYFTYEGAVLR
jgi:hypothetical protein